MQELPAVFLIPVFKHIFCALDEYSQIPILGFLGDMHLKEGSHQYLQNAHILEDFMFVIDILCLHHLSCNLQNKKISV